MIHDPFEVWDGVTVVVPGFGGTGLETGDLLWAKFYIEDDKQTRKDSIVASGITYNAIDSSLAKSATETKSEYACPIGHALMWLNHAGNVWVFEFKQTAPNRQTFDYEMQYIKEKGNTRPTVYIRSKKTNTVKASNTMVVTRFGFDLTPLIKEYGDKTTNTLTFNVKYLLGFDAGGKEIFTPFQMNPVELPISGKSVAGERKIE